MLDFNAPEFLVVAIVALLVIGPKDLPKAMRFVGQWVGKARRVASQFRSGLDTMVREAELAELEKKWAEENARIMREYPAEHFLPPPVDAPPPAPVGDAEDAPPVLTDPPATRRASAARKPRKPRKKAEP